MIQNSYCTIMLLLHTLLKLLYLSFTYRIKMVAFWCETQEDTLENILSLFSPRELGELDVHNVKKLFFLSRTRTITHVNICKLGAKVISGKGITDVSDC